MSSRPILVIGPHRSGTSTVTRLINLMGASVGEPEELIGASEENPKGFWERADLIAINDTLLDSQGATWSRISEWNPDTLEDEARAVFRRALHDVLRKLPTDAPCVLKDPRQCLTLEETLALLPDAVCVFVYRPPEEVAVSLEKRNAIPFVAGMALWQAYTAHALNAMLGKRAPIFVAYHDVVNDPWAVTQRLLGALQAAGMDDLTLPPEADVRAFIEPALHRSRKEENPHPVAQSLLDLASGATPLTERITLPHEVQGILELYDMVEVMRDAQSAQGELLTLLAGALHVADQPELERLNAMLLQARHMQAVIADRDAQLQMLNHKIEAQESVIDEQRQRLLRLDVLLGELERSTSWEVARGVIRAVSLVKGRDRSSALDEARKLAGQ